jgi:hypothetical protein
MSAPQAVETFEIIVGYQPHQEIFTVPRDLLMRRSDLFKTVLSPRWSWFTRHSSLKPVDLSEEYPDTFATSTAPFKTPSSQNPGWKAVSSATTP